MARDLMTAGTINPENLEAAPSRLLWADTAKGLSILLVVLWHVTDKHLPLARDAGGSRPGFWLWEQVSYTLEPARMPLFFILAGMFASKSLSRPPLSVVRKPVNSYYVFVVWLLLSIPLGLALGSLAVNPVDTWFELFAGLALGATGPWFLYALAIYYVLAYALKKVPVWLVLPTAATASMLSYAGLFEGAGNFHYVAANAFFYFAGIYAPRVVSSLAEKSRLLTALPVFSLAIALGIYVSTDSSFLFPFVRLMAGIFGCIGLIMMVAALSRNSNVISRAMAWLGRRTLGIYVLHLHVLVIWQTVVFSIELPISASVLDTFSYIYVPGTVFVLAALSVAIKSISERCGLGALFTVPRASRFPLARPRKSSGRHVK